MNALRGRSLLALTAAVLLAHLWLADSALPTRLGEGAADTPRPRIEVAFVRELQQAAPPAAPPSRARPRPRLPTIAPAASAPDAAPDAAPDSALDTAAAAPPPELAAATEPLPPPADSLPALAELAPAVDAAASAPAAFEWPPSTRLSYTLTGNVRGPVEGQARVEWLRSGTRYQVFLEASIGPSFAPLLTRRDSSEGDITSAGLSPRRYDLDNKILLRDPRRSTIFLDADVVRLPGGQQVPRPPGVQDAVSQFVHLTWLFTTRPELLAPGTSIQMPVALPRRVEPWTYDVLGTETLNTAAGEVLAVHVKPRREARPGGDYVAELWVAPSLQYLPVRIVVRQDAQTYIDLQIERLPQQAERGR